MSFKNVKISSLSYFFIAFVLDGLQRLSGLFVLELLQSTSVSRQTAAVPFIFSWVVSNMIASFSDILIDNKKSEYVILFGVLLSATGAALCILATNITILTLSWGLLFGSGHGLAIPHLSKRLKNESTKSSFILQVPSNLGVAIMPFVFNALNSYYALQGSYLIFCGIILNYIPLALAAAYNIKICIPNIKWRVRKKSKRYVVSKQNEDITVSIESFNDSLEPDLIFTTCQIEKYQDKTTRKNPEFSTDLVLTPVGRKRSETRGNDLPSLEMNTKMFPWNINHSQLMIEIINYEKRRNVFESSFNDTDVVCDEMEHTEPESDLKINCDIKNSFKIFEQNILNMENESDLSLKNKILKCESKELKNSIENCNGNSNALSHICVASANETLEHLDSNKNGNTLQTHEIRENDKETLSKAEEKDNLLTIQTIKTPEKQNLQLSPQFLENKPRVPLNIKVHVEECIFETAEEYWAQSSDSKNLEAKKYSYRNHSNSVLLNMHKIIDSSSQNFSQKSPKCSDFDKPKLLNIYSIPENSKLGYKNRVCEERNYKEKNNCNKIKRIFNYLNGISLRVWFCILLINIIFEINLITLLTMFADFGNDIGNVTSDYKWILVAFGAGGLFGKICCCKISKTIPEKCHAIGVVLFLLTGLSTAGVLYSSNLNWLAGFYCILGALEGGITHIIPKFISEYIEKDAHFALSSLKSFFSGVAIICIPYIIGLFRDELGDYEFLLQILSCSSVLCAFLAYILPYLRRVSNKHRNPFSRDK